MPHGQSRNFASADDKNDPLFCGFAEANFFATWGNAHFSFHPAPKSTEKYPVFIIGALPLSSQPFVLHPFAAFHCSDRIAATTN